MVSERHTSVGAMALIASHAENLPPYVRVAPEDWSRIVQAATFGKEAEKVTKEQYEELIGTVRKIRAWLRDKGNKAEDHPDYRDTDHQIFWLEDAPDDETPGHSISVEPRPWDRQLAVNLEPSPKFTVETPIDDYKVHFDLNFDDTYYLSVSNGHLPRFEINALPRREMTRMEYELINEAIAQTVLHFEIDLGYAAKKKEAEERESTAGAGN